MAPVLNEPDKEPDSPSPPPRHLGRTLHALLKSNLKNLLADCGVRPDCGDFSAPAGAMKNVLGAHCTPSDSIMDSGKPESDDAMGLHSVNSANLQDLLSSKKQMAGALRASSPTPDLVDMIAEFETVARAAPLAAGNGNGDVPAEELQMISRLVTSMDETPLTADAARDTQARLEGRSQRLFRRLRALETRSARRQTTAAVGALVGRLSAAAASSSAAAAGTAPAATDITEMLRSPDAKHFSTTQLVNLVLNNKPPPSAAQSSAPSSAAPSVPPTPERPSTPVPPLRPEREAAAAAVRPAGAARRQLTRLAAADDSDATESSSGGESGDEFDHGWDDYGQERAAPIRKRALWRWVTERSAVGSRWSWLAAQVTDLEFRIRQLRDIHRQLRAANPRPANGRSSGVAIGRQATARELGGAGDASSGRVLADKASEAAPDAAEEEQGDGQCARTRRRALGPRRRVFSVVRAPRRPAGGAPARCRCDPGRQVCIVCAGRPERAAPPLRPGTQTAGERRALLQPSYHPVLSFPGEAALSLDYDGLLRCPRWAQNHLHARPRGPRLATKEAGSGAQAAAGSQPGTPAAVSAPAPPGATPGSPPPAVPPVRRPSFHRRKSGVLKRLHDSWEDDPPYTPHTPGRVGRPPKLARRSASVCGGAAAGGPPRDARPAAAAGAAPAPADDDWLEERRESRERRYRHRQNSYDIDNIVIPASMASTARIEKPKYKEIQTPGWRAASVSPGAVANGAAANGPEFEPLDDAAYEQRHLAAELAERRRLYQSCQAAAAAGGTPGPGRGRRAHTPDTPAPADPAAAAAAAARPRILRYLYVAQPCGFPPRQFPLSERVWKELQAAGDSALRSPRAWRSPSSVVGSSTESAPETDLVK